MTSAVSICSNALLRLGDKPIASFGDNTDRSNACSNLYPQMRDAVLRAHPWNCATKRILLAPLADTPAFDYRYQYQLPADWLRTIQIGARDYPFDFTIEGQRILTDAQSLPLVYIFRNDTEATWDADLVDVMVAAMTAILAYPITQSASEEQVKLAAYTSTLKSAKAVNGQDDRDETLGDFPLLSNRINGWRGVPGR